jgi:hypothetical protein
MYGNISFYQWTKAGDIVGGLCPLGSEPVLRIRITSDPELLGQAGTRKNIPDPGSPDFDKKPILFLWIYTLFFKVYQFVFDYIHISLQTLATVLLCSLKVSYLLGLGSGYDPDLERHEK